MLCILIHHIGFQIFVNENLRIREINALFIRLRIGFDVE